MPESEFFSYRSAASPQQTGPEWNAFLPTNRKASSPSPEIAVSYGDYFLAAKAFLERRFPDAEKISIRIRKHGEFYHPASATVIRNGIGKTFVVNAAISEIGKHCIEREYRLLKQLGKKVSPSFVPEVYAFDSIRIADGREIPMFLGEWFEGYHEFHLSRNADGGMGIIVWDEENGNHFLSEDEEFSLYRQMANILTRYYDIESFRQIFPWHHAAGDFVVRRDGHGDLSVRLITVRQYAAPMEAAENDSDAMMEGLLAFLTHLSIRMRLDRSDGVGDIAWADDMTVKATVSGFFDALRSKPSLPETSFRNYLLSWTRDDLAEMAEAIVGSYDSRSPDTAAIRTHLPRHIALLSDLVLSEVP